MNLIILSFILAILLLYILNCFQKQEIKRLNNIINELEVFLKEGTELATGCGITTEYVYAYENVLDKLQELKGEDKE